MASEYMTADEMKKGIMGFFRDRPQYQQDRELMVVRQAVIANILEPLTDKARRNHGVLKAEYISNAMEQFARQNLTNENMSQTLRELQATLRIVVKPAPVFKRVAARVEGTSAQTALDVLMSENTGRNPSSDTAYYTRRILGEAGPRVRDGTLKTAYQLANALRDIGSEHVKNDNDQKAAEVADRLAEKALKVKKTPPAAPAKPAAPVSEDKTSARFVLNMLLTEAKENRDKDPKSETFYYARMILDKVQPYVEGDILKTVADLVKALNSIGAEYKDEGPAAAMATENLVERAATIKKPSAAVAAQGPKR